MCHLHKILNTTNHSPSRKSGTFYCIINRINKITLLLPIAVFDAVKIVLIQDSANIESVNTFRYSKHSKCLPPTFARSQPLSKTRIALLIESAENNVPYIIQCEFQFRNCFWLWSKLSKSFANRSSGAMSSGNSNLKSKLTVVPSQSFATLRVQALWSNKSAVCADPQCISLNLLLRLAATGCSFQWILEAEINKHL